MTTSLWKWSIGIYYVLAITLRPDRTCQWPFQTDDLLLFGVIPLVAAIVGLSVCRDHTQRVLSWMVFSLAIGGICLSFLPWRQAIGDWAVTLASVYACAVLFSALYLVKR